MALPLITLALMGANLAAAKDSGDRARALADERNAQAREDRKFATSERDRLLRMRQELADAAAPVQAKQVAKAGELTVGDAGPELAGADQFSAGAGTSFPTMQQAQTAATSANAPGAKLMRMGATLEKFGEAGQAQQLRSGGRQEELASLQLDDARRQHLANKFDASLQSLASHADIAGAVSNSSIGGSLKLQAVTTPDGKKTEYVALNPDGTTRKTGYSFGNDATGVMQAKLALSQAVPMHQKLDFLFRQQQADIANAHNERDFSLRERLTNTQIQHMRNQDARAAEAAKQARQTAAAPVWNQAADDFLIKRNTIQDPMTGKSTADGMGVKFEKQLAVAEAMRNGGDVTSALGYAIEISNQIARENDGDPAKINAARSALLKSLRPATKVERQQGQSEIQTQQPPKGTGAAQPLTGMGSATGMQEAPKDPLNGLSASQAREKRKEFVSEIARWGADPNASKRVSELRALIDRIDNNQY